MVFNDVIFTKGTHILVFVVFYDFVCLRLKYYNRFSSFRFCVNESFRSVVTLFVFMKLRFNTCIDKYHGPLC